MCHACRTSSTAIDPRRAVTKLTARERQLIEQFSREYARKLKVPHETIVELLEESVVDLSSEGAIQAEVQQAFDERGGDLDAVVTDMHVDGASVGREVAIQRHALEISFDLTRPQVIDVLEARALTMSQATTERMVGDITGALSRAYQEGMSIDDITTVLQEDVFEDMRGYEAERVARTNIISGSNKGAHEAYVDAGALAKEWIATSTGDTRDSHLEADGQVVLLGDKFVVGGHQAEHPGDPSLPLDELINCRCAEAPVFDESRL